MNYRFESRWASWSRIALGLTLGLLLHVGLVLPFFHKSPADEEPRSEVAGAIMIELSTMAVAAPIDPLDLPEGPAAEETPAVPDTPKEIAPAKTSEAPILNRTPYDPDDPDLKFKVANPDQKETETEYDAEAPPTEMQDQPETNAVAPIPETTAPPPIEAEEGEEAAAKDEGMSKELEKAIASWQKELLIKLARNKRYPREARRKRIQGMVDLWFRIDKYGRIIEQRVVDDRGHTVLGEAALAILERAGKLPAPPSGMLGEDFEFKIPIEFKIK